MMETRHIFLTVNGHVYGVYMAKGRSYIRKDSPDTWRIHVAEYGVDNAISMAGIQTPFDPVTKNEYDDPAQAVGAAYSTILAHQAEENERATSHDAHDVLAGDPEELPAGSRPADLHKPA